MPIVEKDGKFYPLRTDGKPYKQGYTSRAKAEAAIEKAAAFWGSKGPTKDVPEAVEDIGAGEDTAAERKRLGILPYYKARGEF